MKIIYSFMIGLILFNFYACTKQSYDPNDLYAKSNLEITYLDENNNQTETRTDTILMKLKDDESGFIMVSKMTNKNECIDYLIDTENNSTISMFYTNQQEAFPYKIVIVQGEESMVGYTSKYREETKDFDIIWEMSDGSSDTFKDIPISNIFNHAKTSGVDDNTDYQIKTLKVSIRIADAINKYIDDNYNPLTRGIWGKFCSFWKKILKPILVVIAVIVSIIFPPVAPIFTVVIKGIDNKVNEAIKLMDEVEDIEKASSGIKELFILKTKNNYDKDNMYMDNEKIYIKNKEDTESITFDVTAASIGRFELWLSIPNEDPEAGSGIISGYYKFDYNRDTRCFYPSFSGENKNSSSGKQPNFYMNDFNNNSDFNLIIKRLANSVNHDVYIDIKLMKDVFINKVATNSFKLILQKDLIE